MSEDRRNKRRSLLKIYHALWDTFGPQGWWPGQSPFEVAVGAILAQNTAWTNVEITINRLKAEKVLSPVALHRISVRKLAPLLRSSGYFNVKASRLKNFIDFLYQGYQGRLDALFREDLFPLRKKFLGISGIGPETADSILLYAGKYPIFVADAYTRRIFFRHGFLNEGAAYHEIQALFMNHLPKDVALYNEYHALIVRVGKEFCRKGTPRCEVCPLSPFLPSFASPS